MSRTPRRDPRAGDDSPAAHTTPTGPPPGILLSKLGVQATARDGIASGIMCLKFTLPKEGDGYPNRWGLFNGKPPKLLAIPAIYPIPASPSLHRSQANLMAATRLLGLPPPGSYPPPGAEPSGPRPYMDISQATGQVFVQIDGSPSPTPGRDRRRRESMSAVRDRSEWLVIMEFAIPVQSTEAEGGGEVFKVVLPIPKVLDNVLRFQIIPTDPNSEVSVVSDPKIQPRSISAPFSFRDAGSPSPRRARIEDGWEDGEVPGAESESDDDEGGSWLEGVFQATEKVTLEWGFVPSLGSPPDLRITPQWDSSTPSIGVAFEANLPSNAGALRLDAILPPGWGWKEIEIRADGLLSWHSSDGHGLSAIASNATVSPNDTLDANDFGLQRRDLGLAPLDDDFSFELNSFDGDRPRRSMTPNLRRTLTAERADGSMYRVVPRIPVPAAEFELNFASPSVDEDDEDDNRVLLLTGTLVPLPLTLVSPDVPVAIPFVRVHEPSLPLQCVVSCPNATLLESLETASTATRRLCDIDGASIGTFLWVDGAGRKLAPPQTAAVAGPVRVIVQRNVWGVQTVSVAFVWPARAPEVAINLAVSDVRVVKASAGTTQLASAVIATPAGTQLRLRGGRGGTELVLEAAEEMRVALPTFPDATGEMQVELVGDSWDKIIAATKPQTNLSTQGPRAFRGDLSIAPHLSFSPPPPAEPTSKYYRIAGRLFSMSTVINLLILWAVGSLAGQVQRLRAEVGFVADETRDLRLYGFERRHWEEQRERERERERAWSREWERQQRDRERAHGEEQHDQGDQHDSETQAVEDDFGWAGEANGDSGVPIQPADSQTDQQEGHFQKVPPVPPPESDLEWDETLEHVQEPDYSWQTPPDETDLATVNYGIGRVVLDSSRWTRNPAVQVFTSSVAWIWRTLRSLFV